MADDEDPLEQFMAEIEQVTQQYQDTSDEKQTTANNNDDCINKVVHANTPVSASAKHNDDKRDLDEEMAPGEGYDPKRVRYATHKRQQRLRCQEMYLRCMHACGYRFSFCSLCEHRMRMLT